MHSSSAARRRYAALYPQKPHPRFPPPAMPVAKTLGRTYRPWSQNHKRANPRYRTLGSWNPSGGLNKDFAGCNASMATCEDVPPKSCKFDNLVAMWQVGRSTRLWGSLLGPDFVLLVSRPGTARGGMGGDLRLVVVQDYRGSALCRRTPS